MSFKVCSTASRYVRVELVDAQLRIRAECKEPMRESSWRTKRDAKSGELGLRVHDTRRKRWCFDGRCCVNGCVQCATFSTSSTPANTTLLQAGTQTDGTSTRPPYSNQHRAITHTID
ncbi:unnamed protein product [Toxocara canis]|uniref:Uncharacterized protein n=1 Tax=Toxocara canis TaxID=6265 RepID=A0A183UC42_TOXCA|nr:unnamed protein product [Toxocara canis]